MAYSITQRKRKAFVDRLVQFSRGLDEKLVEAVVLYTECHQRNGISGIDENTCMAQLSYQFNLTSSLMMTLIFDAMKTKKNARRILTLEEFCKLICIFLTPNLDLKIDFVFSVYDTDSNGTLDRTEVYSMLKIIFPADDEDPDESIKDIIELVMKAVDRDNNNFIDKGKFRNMVKKDVLGIELLGRCLPDDQDVNRFKKKLSDKTPLQLKHTFRRELAETIIGCFPRAKSPSYYPIKLDM